MDLLHFFTSREQKESWVGLQNGENKGPRLQASAGIPNKGTIGALRILGIPKRGMIGIPRDSKKGMLGALGIPKRE